MRTLFRICNSVREKSITWSFAGLWLSRCNADVKQDQAALMLNVPRKWANSGIIVAVGTAVL